MKTIVLNRQEKFIKALQETKGNVKEASNISDIAFQTHYYWLYHYPQYRRKIKALGIPTQADIRFKKRKEEREKAKKRLINEFIKANAHLGKACDNANVGRSSHSRWILEDEQYRRTFDKIRDVIEEGRKEKFIKALKRNRGDIQKALDKTGITQYKIDSWAWKDNAFKSELKKLKA